MICPHFIMILACITFSGANSLSAIGSGIVMITIPWLLIKESGGETTFGYVSIIATLIMFLLTPFIGQSIDRFSRKSLLLCNEGIGIAVIGIMVIWGFAGNLIILFTIFLFI